MQRNRRCGAPTVSPCLNRRGSSEPVLVNVLVNQNGRRDVGKGAATLGGPPHPAQCCSAFPPARIHVDRELERRRTGRTGHPLGCPSRFGLSSQVKPG